MSYGGRNTRGRREKPLLMDVGHERRQCLELSEIPECEAIEHVPVGLGEHEHAVDIQ